jgi:hypothetical protein
MKTAVAICWLAFVGWSNVPEQPKDPATLGYQEVPAPTLVRKRAYSDIEPEPGSEEASWLAAEQTRLDAAYGPVEDYTKDLSAIAVADSLQRATMALHQSPTFNDPNGKIMRTSLEAEFQQTASELAALAGEVVPADFGARLQATQAIATTVEANIVYFNSTDRQVIFKATLHSGSAARSAYYSTPEQALEFRAAVGRVFAIAAQTRGKILKQLSVRLGDLNSAWDHYLINGFSQFPWESYVNAYVTPSFFGRPSWYDPPKDQLVFMHPELGMLADTRSRSSADVQAALFVDAIGYVHYFGDDRGWFLGASAAASLSNDDVGLGIGPMLHFGNSGRGSQLPNVSLGLLWHEPSDGRDGWLVGISVDLWRLFDKTGPEGVLRSAFPELTR